MITNIEIKEFTIMRNKIYDFLEYKKKYEKFNSDDKYREDFLDELDLKKTMSVSEELGLKRTYNYYGLDFKNLDYIKYIIIKNIKDLKL